MIPAIREQLCPTNRTISSVNPETSKLVLGTEATTGIQRDQNRVVDSAGARLPGFFATVYPTNERE